MVTLRETLRSVFPKPAEPAVEQPYYPDPEFAITDQQGMLIRNPFEVLRARGMSFEAMSEEFRLTFPDSFGAEQAWKMIRQFNDAGRLDDLRTAGENISVIQDLMNKHGKWVLKHLAVNYTASRLQDGDPEEIAAELHQGASAINFFKTCLEGMLALKLELSDLMAEKDSEYEELESDIQTIVRQDFYKEFKSLLAKNDSGRSIHEAALQLSAQVRLLRVIKTELLYRCIPEPSTEELQEIIEQPAAVLNNLAEKAEARITLIQAEEAQGHDAQQQKLMDSRLTELNSIFGRNTSGNHLHLNFDPEYSTDQKLEALKLMITCAIDKGHYSRIQRAFPETGHRQVSNKKPPLTKAERCFLETVNTALANCPANFDFKGKRGRVNNALENKITELGGNRQSHGPDELTTILAGIIAKTGALPTRHR